MPKARLETVAAVAALVGIMVGAGGAPEAREAENTGAVAEVSFAEDIMPILEASCVTCHGGEDDGEPRKEALLDLTSYEGVMAGSEFGSVVEPGDPDESMLFVLVRDGDMPEEGDLLTTEQIEMIRAWIAEGAKNN